MNDEISPSELSELFINGFELMSLKERRDYQERLSKEYRSQKFAWRLKFEDFISSLADPDELDYFVFFKKELPHGVLAFVYLNIKKPCILDYRLWHLVLAPGGIPNGEIYCWDKLQLLLNSLILKHGDNLWL